MTGSDAKLLVECALQGPPTTALAELAEALSLANTSAERSIVIRAIADTLDRLTEELGHRASDADERSLELAMSLSAVVKSLRAMLDAGTRE